MQGIVFPLDSLAAEVDLERLTDQVASLVQMILELIRYSIHGGSCIR